MGAFEHQIEELVAFARDRDNNDRSVLFCELTELFVSGTAPQAPNDREHLLEVIEALVPHVAPNTRAGVAGQLSDMHHPPMDLVMRLIYDDPDLVANLIVHAPMDEDSLIEFVAKTGRAHHQELATRTDLSASVWIALARAAPAMPINRLHNEDALWADDLGKDHKPDGSNHTKNAEELGINLFMTRPAPEEKINVRPQTSAGIKNIKRPRKAAKDHDNGSEAILSQNVAANDLLKNTLSRREKRALDEHVLHPMPKATVEVEDFNWEQHVTSTLGWALLTNRDGCIADLSHSARMFMGLAAERLINMDLIDLIGLADRPEHPVVRALLRHGAIHDAPVVLFVGPVGRASWTLTALPKFGTTSGLFEGFNCHFSPVPVTDEDIPVFLDEVDIDDDARELPVNLYKDNNITSITGEVPIISETPLFLEEDEDEDEEVDYRNPSPLITDPDVTEALTEAVAKNMNMSVESIREQAKDMARNRMSEIQSKLQGNEIQEWPQIISEATLPTEPTDKPDMLDLGYEDYVDEDLQEIFEPEPIPSEEPKVQNSIPKAKQPQSVPQPPMQEKAAPKASAAKPSVAKPSVTQKQQHTQDPQQDALSDLIETTRRAQHAIATEENLQKMHLQRIATIKHMLSMMEEAGKRLNDQLPDEDPLAIQLDADIAKTCAKALRDLLENKIEK